MKYAEVLEKYLYRIARGEMRDLDPLVPLIAPSIFYVPVLEEQLVGKKAKIKFPVVQRLNKKYFPIFLRRSHLVSSYEKLKVSPQEIRGETLLAMLPLDFGLLFEPNSSLEVIFTREDLGLNSNRSVSESEPVEFDLKKLEENLKKDLRPYPEVSEAFFMPHKSSYSDAILGLLRAEMDDERRYDLSESIAKTSTDFYGYAGAIEIFDDLTNPDSIAWTKFKSEVPFYNRDYITDQIEVSKTVNKADYKREGLMGSLGNLKKSGLKIFYS